MADYDPQLASSILFLKVPKTMSSFVTTLITQSPSPPGKSTGPPYFEPIRGDFVSLSSKTVPKRDYRIV